MAIARVVLSTKQHLCMLRSVGKRLLVTTLVWAREVLEAPDVPSPTSGGRELQMAEQLVRSMRGTFEPARFRDEHRERVEAVVRKKAKGQTIEPQAEPRPGRVVDLARALEESLAAARPAPRARPARARRRATLARARARRAGA